MKMKQAPFNGHRYKTYNMSHEVTRRESGFERVKRKDV